MSSKVLKHNVQITHKVYKELELINDKLEAQVCELGQTLKLAEQQVELTSKHVGLVGDFLSIEQSEFMQRSRHTQLEREHEAVKDLLKQVAIAAGATDGRRVVDVISELRQEHNHLREQLQEASIEAGLTDGETLASVIRLLKNLVEDREKRYEHLRGLIEALPAMTQEQLGAAIDALFKESWPSSFSAALAALLRERQRMEK
mgnify:CR=1 FL=1